MSEERFDQKIEELIQGMSDFPVSCALEEKIIRQVRRKRNPFKLIVNKVSQSFEKPYIAAPIAASLLFTLTWFGLNNHQSSDMKSRNVIAKESHHLFSSPSEEFELHKVNSNLSNAWIKPVSLGNFEDNFKAEDHFFESEQQNEADPVLSDALASFKFKRALSLRAQGDYQGCADLLDHILKTHPDYARSADVLTIRIDSLFRLGKDYDALKEFSYLKSFDPTHAEILEQRWLQNR